MPELGQAAGNVRQGADDRRRYRAPVENRGLPAASRRVHEIRDRGGEVSLRTEPGVLTMYAVSEKENPCKVTILETYASREAYEKHIASEHFQKYKQGTLHMVKSLVLSDQTPLNPANRINNFIQ